MTQEEKRAAFVAELLVQYKDGLSVSDLWPTAVACMEYVGQYEDWAGADKKAEVLAILKEVLASTDGPGPDALVDPLAGMLLSHGIDYIVEAARGKLNIGK